MSALTLDRHPRLYLDIVDFPDQNSSVIRERNRPEMSEYANVRCSLWRYDIRLCLTVQDLVSLPLALTLGTDAIKFRWRMLQAAVSADQFELTLLNLIQTLNNRGIPFIVEGLMTEDLIYAQGLGVKYVVMDS